MGTPYILHALPSQIIHPRNLWVPGSNLTGGHLPAKLP